MKKIIGNLFTKKEDQKNKDEMRNITLSTNSVDKLKNATYTTVYAEIVINGKTYTTKAYPAKVIGVNNILSPTQNLSRIIRNSQWVEVRAESGKRSIVQTSHIESVVFHDTGSDPHTPLDTLLKEGYTIKV